LILGGPELLADTHNRIGACAVVGAAAGSLFVFKGIYRAVLITYPARLQQHDLIGAALRR